MHNTSFQKRVLYTKGDKSHNKGNSKEENKRKDKNKYNTFQNEGNQPEVKTNTWKSIRNADLAAKAS